MPAPWFALPELQRFARAFPDGAYLFRQGEAGQTLFIITEGRVALLAEAEDQPRLVAWIEPGSILGEKALMTRGSHQRRFTAQAHGEVRVLEIGNKDFESLRLSSPQVVIDLLRAMFLVTQQRFDRVNYLARGLKSSDDAERLIHVLMYLRHSGSPPADGTEAQSAITVDAVSELIDLPPPIVADAIGWLVRRSLVRQLSQGSYQIPHEGNLLAATDSLRAFLDERKLESAA
jgi:CRP-like cAMP-binding protein